MPKSQPARAPVAPAPIADDPWLYFEDVAVLFEIEPRTLRHLRASKQGPPFIKVGRRLRVRRSKAEAWFADKYETASA